MKTSSTELGTAAAWLAEHDPVMADLVEQFGVMEIKPHKNYYLALVESIISQQLSVKAADTIEGRFKSLYDNKVPSPEQILATKHEAMRAVGLSNAKANYIRDLAEHVLSGKVKFNAIDKQSNETIIAELTDVKGIGEWTVHMFLMFCVGRLDILASGDLGVRKGVQNAYGLDHTPTPLELTDLAQINHWEPYQTVACLYLWKSYAG